MMVHAMKMTKFNALNVISAAIDETSEFTLTVIFYLAYVNTSNASDMFAAVPVSFDVIDDDDVCECCKYCGR